MKSGEEILDKWAEDMRVNYVNSTLDTAFITNVCTEIYCHSQKKELCWNIHMLKAAECDMQSEICVEDERYVFVKRNQGKRRPMNEWSILLPLLPLASNPQATGATN